MNVTAVIPTRGDVPMGPILESLPAEWEILVWDNGAGSLRRERAPEWSPMNVLCGTTGGAPPEAVAHPAGWACSAYTVADLAVYARYEAISYAHGDLIFTQDDDVIVSDPDAIRGEWQRRCNEWNASEHLYTEGTKPPWPGVVCNMPPEFRHAFYEDHALVGFGACFHRNAPQRAFERYARFYAHRARIDPDVPVGLDLTSSRILRTCDMVFAGLTPRVLVEVPKENLPYAEDAGRMYRTPGYVTERQDMLDLVRQVRDGQ